MSGLTPEQPKLLENKGSTEEQLISTGGGGVFRYSLQDPHIVLSSEFMRKGFQSGALIFPGTHTHLDRGRKEGERTHRGFITTEEGVDTQILYPSWVEGKDVVPLLEALQTARGTGITASYEGHEFTFSRNGEKINKNDACRLLVDACIENHPRYQQMPTQMTGEIRLSERDKTWQVVICESKEILKERFGRFVPANATAPWVTSWEEELDKWREEDMFQFMSDNFTMIHIKKHDGVYSMTISGTDAVQDAILQKLRDIPKEQQTSYGAAAKLPLTPETNAEIMIDFRKALAEKGYDWEAAARWAARCEGADHGMLVSGQHGMYQVFTYFSPSPDPEQHFQRFLHSDGKFIYCPGESRDPVSLVINVTRLEDVPASSQGMLKDMTAIRDKVIALFLRSHSTEIDLASESF